jgi:hypothetical protein
VNAAQRILAILESEYCAEDVVSLTDRELQALKDRATNVYWHTIAERKARIAKSREEKSK